MTALRLKLWRDVTRAKLLMLAIASIIAVGVNTFVAMQSAYYNLDRARQHHYRLCRMADFWVELKKAPLAELGAIADLPGIAEVLPRLQFAATVDLETVIEPINAVVISLPDRREPVINDVVLRQGSYFSDRRADEVLVSDKFAQAHGLFPGRTFHLLVNNRRQELFVVGTVKAAEFTYAIGPGAIVPDPVRFGVLYVKRSFAEEVFDFRGAANQLVGHFTPQGRAAADEVLRRIEDRLEPYGVFTTTPLHLQASNQFLANEIAGLGSIATVIPSIFLLVAALVLNVLLTRMARRQRTVIGTFKALGYSNWQLFAHFLEYGVWIGVLGAVLGSVLGSLAAWGMTVVYSWFFDFPELHSRFYPHTHALGLVVSVTCALGGSLHAARDMLRLDPAIAMRPEPPRHGGKVWIERMFGGAWDWLGTSWRVVLRNLFRHRLRTLTSVFAAAMGAGLLVSGFMLTVSQDFLIDFQFYRLSRSDLDITFEDERGLEAADEIRRLPGVDYAEPWLTVAGTFVHGPYRRKAGITGLVSDARLTVPRDQHGAPLVLPDSGVIMTRWLADLLHVEAGDQVELIPTKGSRRPIALRVAQIADGFLGLSVYAELGFLSRQVDESLAISGVQIETDRESGNLENLYRELKKMPAVQSVTARRQMIRLLAETILQNQFVLMFMLVLFAGVIFFGSVLNTSMVNLAERQSEVATLLAIGYSPWQLGGMFFRESLVTNLPGALLGLPFGYLLMWLTAWSYNNDTLRMPVMSAPWVWWLTLGLAALFALSAQLVVQWNILTMNVVETLKVKE